jgi:hypothetical protein
MYNVIGSIGQVLRVSLNLYALTIAAADSIVLSIQYTDLGGTVRNDILVTYVTSNTTQAVPSMIIIAKTGTVVNAKTVATISTNYRIAYNIEYVADFA